MRQPTTRLVLDVLRKYPNQDVAIGQIMEETRLSRKQVQAAIYNMIKRGDEKRALNLTVVMDGNIYRYSPNPPELSKAPPKTMVYEFLATLRNGDIVIQDTDGKLYRATELT